MFISNPVSKVPLPTLLITMHGCDNGGSAKRDNGGSGFFSRTQRALFMKVGRCLGAIWKLSGLQKGIDIVGIGVSGDPRM